MCGASLYNQKIIYFKAHSAPSHMDERTPDDFLTAARDIQNQIGRHVGLEGLERRFFREFFGTTISIACIVWNLLVQHCLLPQNGKPKHLLWTLYFFNVYPKQGPACSGVGGSSGAIDPKTLWKWVWKFADAICELHVEVVSYNLSSCCSTQHHSQHLTLDTSCLD